jgi:hypothetical protein
VDRVAVVAVIDAVGAGCALGPLAEEQAASATDARRTCSLAERTAGHRIHRGPRQMVVRDRRGALGIAAARGGWWRRFNGRMDAGDAERPEGSSLADVTRSARGWHGVQLAVLAFIGLCGVLSDSDPATPRGLQVTAGVLAISALVLACVSVFLVATVAWPFPTGVPSEPSPGRGRGTSGPAARRLRVGVALTYVAVAAMALAASSSWWPSATSRGIGVDGAARATVEITDRSGRTACGELVEGPEGRIRLATDAGTVELATNGVALISPVDAC